MASIYALMSGQLCLYIGSTIQSLATRASAHRTGFNYCGSTNIPEYIDWDIVLLEECPVESRYVREGFYYNKMTPLYNERIPGRTRTEIHADYEIRNAEKRKLRRQTEHWKELNRKRMRNYRLRLKQKDGTDHRLPVHICAEM